MSASFAILKTAENEGGYAKPYGKSGETYAGIDRLHVPGWPGWKIIDQIKRTRGIRQYEFIKGNAQLDTLVEAAHKKYFDTSRAGKIANTNLSAFYFDFYFHKPAIAVGFLNDYAAAAVPGIETAGSTLTADVITFINANAVKVYQKLWQDRMAHYKIGKHPESYTGEKLIYKTSKNGLMERVKKYPPVIALAKFKLPKSFLLY